MSNPIRLFLAGSEHLKCGKFYLKGMDDYVPILEQDKGSDAPPPRIEFANGSADTQTVALDGSAQINGLLLVTAVGLNRGQINRLSDQIISHMAAHTDLCLEGKMVGRISAMPSTGARLWEGKEYRQPIIVRLLGHSD